MKGSIVSRGKDVWLIRYYPPGSRKQKSSTFRGSYEDAELELARLLREVRNGLPTEPEKVTVAELLDKWLEVKKGKVKDTTWYKYQMYVGMWKKTFIADSLLHKLNPLDIEIALSRFNLSPKTISILCVILKTAFKKAVQWKLIPYNPMDAVEPPRIRHKEIQIWSEDEALKFLEVSRGSKYHVLFYLALKTGLRLGELLALEWRNVDLDKGEIYVMQTMVELPTGRCVQSPKTRRSIRRVPLDNKTLVLLKQHKKKCMETAVKLGIGKVKWVFWREQTQQPPTASAIQIAFHKLIKKAGVPDIKFHSLRHTHATFLLRQGIHMKIVADRLGHETVRMTDLYSHILPDSQQEAVKAMERMDI